MRYRLHKDELLELIEGNERELGPGDDLVMHLDGEELLEVAQFCLEAALPEMVANTKKFEIKWVVMPKKKKGK